MHFRWHVLGMSLGHFAECALRSTFPDKEIILSPYLSAFTRQQNFSLIQIQSIFRRHIKILLKTFNLSLIIGKKTSWEKEEMLVTSIFSVSQQYFQLSFFPRLRQKSLSCVKGLDKVLE